MAAGQGKVGKEIDKRVAKAQSISEKTKAKKAAYQKAVYYLRLAKKYRNL